MTATLRLLEIFFLTGVISVAASGQTLPQAQRTERPAPPTRDPHTPGYVSAKELPDGSIPPANVDGNFIIGPTHNPALELPDHADLANGTVIEFTMSSSESKIYPGIARDAGTFGTSDPSDPAQLT